MTEAKSRQLKAALDEARLLILGVRILLGFQFQTLSQDGFADLYASSRYIGLAALMLLLVLSIASLITPSMLHQFVEAGNCGLLRETTLYAAAALAPLAINLAIATSVTISRSFGMLIGIMCGVLLMVVAMTCWFGQELAAGIVQGDKKWRSRSHHSIPSSIRCGRKPVSSFGEHTRSAVFSSLRC
jgi:hypothetical protein